MNLDFRLNVNINFKKNLKYKLNQSNSLPMPSHILLGNWVSHSGLEPNMLMFLSLLNGNETRTVKDYLNEIKCSLWTESLSYDLSTNPLWGCPFENYCQRLYACFYTEVSEKSFWSWPSFVFSLEKYEWHPFQDYHAYILHFHKVLVGNSETSPAKA